MRLIARLLNSPVSVIVGVSEFKKEIIAALGTFPSGRIRRVYNGVSLELGGERPEPGIAFRERFRIPREKILITQISQITPMKGIGELLEAAQLALSLNPDLHFAIVGDGEYLEQYKKKSVDLGIADYVTWTGLVNNPMAEGVYAASDIVCLASVWQEAFGFAIAEAMACEKVVVATSVGAVPELVEDERTGFVVIPGNPAVMAQKFIMLAQDQALRVRLGLAGRERAATLFDVRKTVDQLLELYGEL
jgi:glycosyltransferase involved in cell wall biosynthesis